MRTNSARNVGGFLDYVLTVAALIFVGMMVILSGKSGPAMPVLGLGAGVAMFIVLCLGPVGKAIARMLATNDDAGDDAQLRLDQLEGQLVDQGYDHQRLAELEESIEFAERLLAAAPGTKLPQHHTPV